MMARDKDEDRFVAIKFMPKNQRHKGKFEKEISVFDALNKVDPYPNGFPKLIAKGKTSHFYYYIMEKLGKWLKKVHTSWKRGKMKVDRVVDIGLQIVDRLEVLHKAGLVSNFLHIYRYIKISNLQISDLEWKILKIRSKTTLKPSI